MVKFLQKEREYFYAENQPPITAIREPLSPDLKKVKSNPQKFKNPLKWVLGFGLKGRGR
ncbi:hypothetical protein MOB34_05990 [Bacillus spizizenii]|nr:hypothetical protein [Bacillus spizizenii]MCY8229227.1 hypothetical protein [Bacillus spizizenii]MCY8888199.1 hypothetical protein [Bacillus spizizenii]MEC0840344.1 hypothetical protein [Bacillus spizizenii]